MVENYHNIEVGPFRYNPMVFARSLVTNNDNEDLLDLVDKIMDFVGNPDFNNRIIEIAKENNENMEGDCE